jgi:hypothetical protein
VGSRLQNDVLYVPVTADGTIIDYRLTERVYDNADFNTWVTRLIEQRIELVVILYPSPIEHDWIEENPELFEQVAASPDGINLAYRFHRDRVPADGVVSGGHRR